MESDLPVDLPMISPEKVNEFKTIAGGYLAEAEIKDYLLATAGDVSTALNHYFTKQDSKKRPREEDVKAERLPKHPRPAEDKRAFDPVAPGLGLYAGVIQVDPRPVAPIVPPAPEPVMAIVQSNVKPKIDRFAVFCKKHLVLAQVKMFLIRDLKRKIGKKHPRNKVDFYDKRMQKSHKHTSALEQFQVDLSCLYRKFHESDSLLGIFENLKELQRKEAVYKFYGKVREITDVKELKELGFAKLICDKIKEHPSL